jgi:hypothetical protein
VEGRERLIDDGDNDDTNNAFQSDFVRLVLNLAYIHEDERLKLLKFQEDRHYKKEDTMEIWAKNTAKNLDDNFRAR